MKRSLRRTLAELNTEGRLALFVGAGISMGCGLPSWSTLVQRVIDEAWKDQPSLASHLTGSQHLLVTRYARKKLGDRFNRVVHACLYRDDYQVSNCVHSIARSGIRNICSLNFDDLIEEALMTAGEVSTDRDGDDLRISRHGSVTVYHPHGVLPRLANDGEVDASPIVLSENDYHGLYADPYSWANLIQLALLSSYSVLFIGLSMQDPSLRRLIDISRSRGFTNQHFAVVHDPSAGHFGEELRQRELVREIIHLDLSSLGITPWFVSSYDDLSEILHRIRRRDGARN